MNNIPRKDYYHFFLVMIACFISVYYMPRIVIQIFFIAILFLAYRSKRDYFWFALFFVLISTPGSIFFGNTVAEIRRLPLYTLSRGLSFSVFDLFLILTLIKSLIKAKPNPMVLKNIFIVLGIFYGFVFIYSLGLGMSSDNLIRFSRNTFFFSLLFSVPRLMPRSEDFDRFAHLVFPFVFLVLVGEFSQIFFNTRLIDKWAGPEKNLNFANARGSSELFERPNLYGVMISFFSLIFGLYYLSRKDYRGNRFYLMIIIITSFITVILFQGRGWISCFILIFLLYLIFVQKLRKSIILPVLTAITGIIIIYSSIKPFAKAVDNGLVRYSTVESLAKGDITAGGTLIRFTDRLPVVMKEAGQNPVTGFGFSDKYWSFADYHVGFATMLLQLGFVGYIIFLVFWIRFYRIIFITNKKLIYANPCKISLLMFSIGLTGILLMHFTSYQFMGFEYMQPADYFFICVFFVFADNQLKQAIQLNKEYME